MSQKALVVDDSRIMRKIIRKVLASVGIDEVVEAADGNEGLQVFQSESPDLVLMDWNMPDRTGVELVRDIRAIDRATPLIMVTTEGEERRICEAFDAGVSEYLVKPFDSKDLQRTLDLVMASH